jgi:hypothetical protein
VDLTDQLIAGGTGDIMLAALLGAAGHGAIGIGLLVCWWRMLRVLASPGERA